MTKEETNAIARIRRAITAAHKLGIRLAGLDDALVFATASAFERGREIAIQNERSSGGAHSYTATAAMHGIDGAGTLDKKCYEDSGAT